MRIGMLSRNRSLYSTRRLAEAARARGHKIVTFDPMRCYMGINTGDLSVHYKGKVLPRFDAIIPRIGVSATYYATTVLRQFESMDVFCLNKSDPILRTRDKLRSHQLLAQAGIGLPRTVYSGNPDDVADLLTMAGPAPHVIKLVEGTQGAGVMLMRDVASSQSVIEAFGSLYANFLVQEFIPEAKGADIRAFVVGGKVIAAMKRQGKPGEFRSNLHRGGSAAKTELSQEETETAIRAAGIMGLAVAGVDILRSKRGPLVLEVNSSPGLEGIENYTKIDVAGAIIEYMEERVKRKVAARKKVDTAKATKKVSPKGK